ncbi:MAG: LAGLIDADG family homing endonuclease [Candidatus Nanoarchaeia archaeon]|nr:LAGLIDADG family homing endonuclease [Candidatus Nanoarchaeia archaeon]MDD5740671.1 LAGLIDADG family homing endonuclease [Candidatus Nanoarchaeia archaeon]
MPYIKKLVMRGFKSFARETTMNLDKNMNVIVGPNGSGKSCDYSTLVKLSNGSEIPIGKLVEEQIKKSAEIKKLDDGIYVDGSNNIEIISLNKSTGKAERRLVSKFIKREGDILYQIRTRTGKEVKATGCHPVITFRDGEIKSILLRDLNVGSLIASPRVLKIGGNQFDKDLARFIGYIIGDGYISKERIEFVNNDMEVIGDYKDILNKFNLHYTERLDKNITRIYINNSSFYKKIKNMFIENHQGSITSTIKKIPDSLLSADNLAISNLLAGLYDTDGSVRKDIAVIEFCTKNQELANQMQGLLLRFGIISKIKKRLCCAKNTKDQTKRPYFYLYVYGIENSKKFYNNIPLKVAHKSENIKSWLSKDLISNPNTDLLPQEINLYVRELTRLLGIKYKPLRKQYPSLAAYIENRCLPSRKGISIALRIFNSKLSELNNLFNDLKVNKINLIKCMDELNISGWNASKSVGLHKTIIRNQWSNNNVSPKQENLVKFYNLIKETFEIRFLRIKELMGILNLIVNSDIYWDKIISIQKLEKPEFVYDLTIEGNHNFIANNLFVHNSNVTDALCFVLGRLSIKSMRAAKASHLIFAGNKQYKKANEAFVEIIIDNEDKTFALNEKEIKIRRIVRKNGQSIYRINNETKTRQEVLELLGQAGIDPHGFNIVLQGEIERFVKMPADERRKVIEEVAGISVYEMRKQKSLNELEKTEEKLKQINTVLRERTNYLKNLENEREQALKFKKLEETVKQCRASIVNRNLQERKKEADEINKKIEEKRKEVNKKNEIITKTQNEISLLNEKIDNISKTIQKSSGIEQDNLMEQLTILKQEIAGSTARKENFENQLNELERRENALKETIKSSEKEISEMAQEKGKNKKKQLEEKKKQLEELDELKRKTYLLKSNISSLENQVEDKKKQIQRLKNESNFILDQIQDTESGIKIKNSLSEHQSSLVKLKQSIKDDESSLLRLENTLLEKQKEIAVRKQQTEKAEKIKAKVQKLDICPLCQTKMTPGHVKEVIEKSDIAISKNKEKISNLQKQAAESENKIHAIKKNISEQDLEIKTREIDIIKLQTIEEKKQQLKRNSEQIKIYEEELSGIEQKYRMTEANFSKIKISEEDYESLKLEVNELQRSEERDLGVEITTKQRELDRIKLVIKQILRDRESIRDDLSNLTEDLEAKQKEAEEKEEQAVYLKQKYQKMFGEKNQIQDKVRMFESNLMHQQNEKNLSENDINNLKINQAEITAKQQNLEEELKQFPNVTLINLPTEKLKEKLNQSSEILARIGSVNLRALEVYEDIKAEYDKIREKVEQLEKEKADILNIIAQIDKKKKRTFLQTLREINALFSRNFSQLSEKGEVILEPQNKDDIFAAGLDITVKTGIGKYFDVTSLSGGEQCLVALSLIFAIQEHKPYCFYIFDEIDAALDKRNSEKLAYLLKKYMKEGQYIIITHNDALISESTNVLYGVSMQEGVSKILSLEV